MKKKDLGRQIKEFLIEEGVFKKEIDDDSATFIYEVEYANLSKFQPLPFYISNSKKKGNVVAITSIFPLSDSLINKLKKIDTNDRLKFKTEIRSIGFFFPNTFVSPSYEPKLCKKKSNVKIINLINIMHIIPLYAVSKQSIINGLDIAFRCIIIILLKNSGLLGISKEKEIISKMDEIFQSYMYS